MNSWQYRQQLHRASGAGAAVHGEDIGDSAAAGDAAAVPINARVGDGEAESVVVVGVVASSERMDVSKLAAAPVPLNFLRTIVAVTASTEPVLRRRAPSDPLARCCGGRLGPKWTLISPDAANGSHPSGTEHKRESTHYQFA